jgi:flagellar motility protein MotE (MotC chaperone)
MFFAELDYTPIWNTLIVSAFGVVMWFLNRRKERADADRADELAAVLRAENAKTKDAVLEVKETLHVNTEEAKQTLGTIVEGVDSTHKIVNDQRTKMVERIDAQAERIDVLESIIKKKDSDAAKAITNLPKDPPLPLH